MSNVYCSIAQVIQMYDLRTVLELSGDDNRHEGQTQNVQFLLDMQASEMESVLQGRYGTVPLTGTIPLVLTKWVGATACRRFFARRTDEPAAVKSDGEWADQWMKDLVENKIGIPGFARHALPDRVAGHRVFEHPRPPATTPVTDFDWDGDDD